MSEDINRWTYYTGPLTDPKAVQRVELRINDAGSNDPCGEESPDNIGYKCTRTAGHDFLSLHSPNLHVASDYDGIITIWGEVS